MTYIELINRFWSIHDDVTFSANEIAIYFFLLREANRRSWPSPFVCPNRLMCMGLGISESTLIRCRDRLVGCGALSFKSGKDKRKAPAYYFQNASSRESSDASSRESSHASSDESSRASIYKTKDKRHKENKPPIPPCTVQGEFDFGKPKKGERKPRGEPPPEPPTIEDVKKHFIAQGAPARILDWEHEAEVFYNHFMSVDWIDARGRKIKRWDSRANLWISDKEKNQNEQSTTSTVGNSGRDEREVRFRAKIMSDLARGSSNSTEEEVPF